MSRGIIVIPTYNEKENVPLILEKVFDQGLDLDVLIVDDSSPDKTAELVQSYIDTDRFEGRLNLMVRKVKDGLGRAYIAGFKWALAREYAYIIEMDADLSHDPKYLHDFIREIKAYDLVIGSRNVEGGGVLNWPASRKLISAGGSLYSRLILGVNIKDVTGGFKCFRREVLETIDLDNLITTGYAFQIEMNYQSAIRGFKIKEVPIIFEDRVHGYSKMSKKIFIEALMKVVVLRLNKNKILKG